MSYKPAALGFRKEKGVANMRLCQSRRLELKLCHLVLGPKRGGRTSLCYRFSLAPRCVLTVGLSVHWAKPGVSSWMEGCYPNWWVCGQEPLLGTRTSVFLWADQVDHRGQGSRKACPSLPSLGSGIPHEATLPYTIQCGVPNEKWPGY